MLLRDHSHLDYGYGETQDRKVKVVSSVVYFGFTVDVGVQKTDTQRDLKHAMLVK